MTVEPAATPQQSVVLFVDDDTTATSALVRSLERRNITFIAKQAATIDEALALQNKLSPCVAVTDLSIEESVGPDSGISLISRLLENDSALRIIVLTGHGSQEYGIQALHRGAASFLEKPVDPSHLLALINDAISYNELKRKYRELLSFPSTLANFSGLRSQSKAMQEVLEQAAYAASNSLPVLILGETGTGKGVISRALFEAQAHHNKKLVSFYPSFITQDLVSSELFGHQKGAFTGAIDARVGLIEDANEGTLFVDEVADLPKETQLLMLRVLQDHNFRRLGANKEMHSDFRLISATNQNLDKLISEDKFRLDFFHRIAHITINLPPLRERREDIPNLAESFLQTITQKEQLSIQGIAPEAMSKLCSYDWPGNIRQLQASIEAGVFRANYSRRRFVSPEDLSLNHSDKNRAKTEQGSFREQVQNYEVKLVQEALARCDNNQSKAAKHLQLDRTSLRRIIARFK